MMKRKSVQKINDFMEMINITPETAESIVRKACGDRKCGFEFNVGKCGRGWFWINPYFHNPYPLSTTPEERNCPHCHGTGYEPITLADVLMALRKYDFLLDSDGYFLEQKDHPWHDSLSPVGIHWSLTSDFHGQSDECKIALARLLSNE